jgi:hypothetical protein
MFKHKSLPRYGSCKERGELQLLRRTRKRGDIPASRARRIDACLCCRFSLKCLNEPSAHNDMMSLKLRNLALGITQSAGHSQSIR